MQRPLISIIILSYNNLEFIYDCLNSVLEQDCELLEIIVTDDGTPGFSCSEILEYINRNKKSNVVSVIVKKNDHNIGTVKNINTALALSKGTYIKLLAADDKLYDYSVLKAFSNYFVQNNEVSIVLSDWVVFQLDGTIVYKELNNYENLIEDNTAFYKYLCKENFICAGATCFRRSLFEVCGYFDEDFRLIEDRPMWFNAIKKGFRFGYLKKTTLFYRSNIGVSSEIKKNTTYQQDQLIYYKKYILPCLYLFPYREKIIILDRYYSLARDEISKKEILYFVGRYWYYTIYKLKNKYLVKKQRKKTD